MGSGEDIYSQMKALWHLGPITQLREGQIPPPVHVHIFLSDLCNQDCAACNYRASFGLSDEACAGNPNRMISKEKAFEILDDCAALGVQAIQFTGGGEPTVHPHHVEIFEYAQSLGLETCLVTNGVLLRPSAAGVQGMTWIRVSIDAGTPQQYAAWRRCPEWHFKRAWENVQALRKLNYAGTLGVGFVVGVENCSGIVEAAQRAKDAGADNMRVSGVTSKLGRAYYGNDNLCVLRIQEYIEEAKAKLNDDRFQVIDLFSRRLKEYEGPPRHHMCYYQHFVVLIGADLSMNRCCNLTYTERGVVGSLKERRFFDFIADDVRASYYPFDARQCAFCQFQVHNTAIRSVVERPEHVNFV